MKVFWKSVIIFFFALSHLATSTTRVDAEILSVGDTFNAAGKKTGSIKGDLRRIRMTDRSSGAFVSTIYWMEGEYFPEVFREIDLFASGIFGREIRVEPEFIDLLSALLELSSTKRSLEVFGISQQKLSQRTIWDIRLPGISDRHMCEKTLTIFSSLGRCESYIALGEKHISIDIPLKNYSLKFRDGTRDSFTSKFLLEMSKGSMSATGGSSLIFEKHLSEDLRTDIFNSDGQPKFSNDCNHVLSGTLQIGDGDRIAMALRKLSSSRRDAIRDDIAYGGIVLCLNSVGGNLRAGLQIAEAVLSEGIPTRVRDKDQCLSACFWIFMAGNITSDHGERKLWRVMELGASVGFHLPTLPDQPYDNSAANVQKAFEYGAQSINEIVETFSMQGGLRDGEQFLKLSVIREALSTLGQSLRQISEFDDAGRWNIMIDLPMGILVPVEDLRSACARLVAWGQDMEADKVFKASFRDPEIEESFAIIKGIENEGDSCKINITNRKFSNGKEFVIPAGVPSFVFSNHHSIINQALELP